MLILLKLKKMVQYKDPEGVMEGEITSSSENYNFLSATVTEKESAEVCSLSCGCGVDESEKRDAASKSKCCRGGGRGRARSVHVSSGLPKSPSIKNCKCSKSPLLSTERRRGTGARNHFVNSAEIPFLFIATLCCIFAILGTADANRKLPDLSIIPTPPTFVHKKNPSSLYYVLDATTTSEGQNSHSLKEVQFTCRAKGYPSVNYKWLKDGSPLNFSDLVHRVVQIPDEGTFKLTRLRASDEGKYECIAENGNGTAVDSPIYLKQTYIKMFAKDDPELVEVELGDPYARTCEPPPSVPDPIVYWILMGEEQGRFNTINSSHISFTDEGTIYFHYIQTDDYKEKVFFTCTAENAELQDYKFGNRFQFVIKRTNRDRLPLTILPTEQYVSPDKTVLKGDEVKLHCFFSGLPNSIPKWKKGGIDGEDVDSIVDLKKRIDLQNFGRTLVITNISTNDAASYACVFDANRALNREIKVTVEAAPYWPLSKPTSKNASEGDSVMFTCGAEGDPTPSFNFYKNGQALTGTEDGYEINGNELHISRVTRGIDGEGHNAVYQCLASNTHGESWANFYLNILAFQPVILDGPGNTDAVMNSEKFLYCKVFGSPMPSVSWRGQALLGNSVEEIPVDAEGLAKLRIASVAKSNEGRYVCFSENKYGNDTAEGNLNVRNATRLTKFPEKEETVFAGREHRFLCQVVHDKNLDVKIQWLHNGVKISEESIKVGRRRVEQANGNSTLVIPETNGADSGTYTCVAESRLDKAERSAKLTVKDVPAPPHTSYLAKCEKEARTAIIRINHHEYDDVPAPVQEFWIEYMIDKDLDNYAWTTFKAPLTKFETSEVKNKIKHISGPLTVDLRPYGNYTFRVIARNEVGDSAPAPVEGECETASAVPDENPSGVRVKGNTEDNLIVYWDPMPREKWNAAGFHYEVEYRKIPEEGAEEGAEAEEWQKEKVEDPYVDHLVVDDMPTFEEYEARVRAVNDEGKADTEPMGVVGYSGEGVPESAPTGFKMTGSTPSTMTFRWDPVDESTVNGELKGFKVYHWYTEGGLESGSRKKRSSPNEKVAYFDKEATEGTVYGMKPNKYNHAVIVVYNGANESPRSDEVVQFLSPGPPSPVRDLNAFALSATEVGVVWRPPKEANGVLQGYNISHCQKTFDNGQVDINKANCPTIYLIEPHHHYRWKLLDPNTEYRFEVRAKGSGGQGDPRSVDEQTLPTSVNAVGKPYEPTLVEAGIGEDHINVTWVPGKFDKDDQRPVGNSHYVNYRVQGAEDWNRADPENGNFTVQLTDLYPGTRYEVVGVSVVKDEQGNVISEEDSPVYYYTTAGEAPAGAGALWLIIIIIAIIFLIIILIIVCLLVRNRGQKYPVSEKEREQGREPMLSKEEKGFGEYARPEIDDEKRSLTGNSKPESETDSMAEYGDGETGRFTEDGSFIGVYGAPNRVLIAPGGQEKGGKSNLSTFV